MNLEIISSANLADSSHWPERSDTFMEPECEDEMIGLVGFNDTVGLHYWFSTRYVELICRIGALLYVRFKWPSGINFYII
jgi:hypothetical protein